jgi:hypothetical protein
MPSGGWQPLEVSTEALPYQQPQQPRPGAYASLLRATRSAPPAAMAAALALSPLVLALLLLLAFGHRSSEARVLTQAGAAGPAPDVAKYARAGCGNVSALATWSPFRPGYHITPPYGWLNGAGSLRGAALWHCGTAGPGAQGPLATGRHPHRRRPPRPLQTPTACSSTAACTTCSSSSTPSPRSGRRPSGATS